MYILVSFDFGCKGKAQGAQRIAACISEVSDLSVGTLGALRDHIEHLDQKLDSAQPCSRMSSGTMAMKREGWFNITPALRS